MSAAETYSRLVEWNQLEVYLPSPYSLTNLIQHTGSERRVGSSSTRCYTLFLSRLTGLRARVLALAAYQTDYAFDAHARQFHTIGSDHPVNLSTIRE